MTAGHETILVVDDEHLMRQVLSALLTTEGFKVIEASNGKACLHLVYKRHPDLILLDIRMPERDGREVLQLVHEMAPQTPVIMLTALLDEREKLERFQDGADDYITKPFHNDELIARIRAVLRRSRGRPASAQRIYEDNWLRVDFDARQLLINGEEAGLSPKQWRLFEYLVEHRDHVVSHAELLHYGWGPGYEVEERYIKVFISHLRKKLDDDPKKPRYIHTVREHGYLFSSRG